MLNENPPSQAERRNGKQRRPGVTPKSQANTPGSKMNESMQGALVGMVTQRNRRNTDWFMESWQGLMTDDEGDPIAFVVNPKGTTLDHFASYPSELVKPCILGSTSEFGCCPECGAPVERIVEDGEIDVAHQRACGGDSLGLYNGQSKKDYSGSKVQGGSDLKRRILASMVEKKTIGMLFTCGHLPRRPVPCTVLDVFHGSGATAVACTALGRQYIGSEIYEHYFKISDARDGQGSLAIL